MKHVIALSFILLLVPSASVQSQSPSPVQQQQTMPLENLLNPDGTINTKSGFSGNLDPRGYRMIEDPNGAPRFVPSQENTTLTPDDVNWDDRFGYSEYGGSILAIAINGSDVYCGGSFLQLENTALSHIAKWDGSNWSALGTGTDGPVYAIAISGSSVYVGGYFTTAGGVSAKNIARWDGSNWSALGSGVDTSGVMFSGAAVFALAVSGTDLYVGGQFNKAGGVNTLSLARWDGANWGSLNSGPDYAVVRAITVMGTNLYVGGYFTAISGVPARCIATWDGANWSALGSGIDSYQWVRALAVIGTDLYAGGEFSTAGGVTVNYIAKWNGTNWSALGTGMIERVYALSVIGTELYAGGLFTIADGVNALHVAKWNGSTWSALGNGIGIFDGSYSSVNVSGLAVIGTDLYAVGSFASAGNSINVQGFARWNGSDWFPIFQTKKGRGIDSYVRAIVTSGTDVYVGGEFEFVGGTGAFGSGMQIERIARWDGTNWNPLGWGIDVPGFQVYAIAVSGSDVYVGGYFAKAGDVLADNIAKWDGTTWSALGTGVNSTVFAIAVSGSDLYVGGQFTTAGGGSANRIARWNGSGWSAVGTGVDSIVYALAVIGNDLYAGGMFTAAGGNPADHIAKWDGASWSPVGSGMNDFVRCMVVSGSDLYVGGGFTTAGGTSASYVATWDGATWSALGTGTNNWVRSVSISGSDLYAGGDFTTAGGVSASYIAKWDGANWFALGSGVNQRVRAIASSGSNVYVGGEFVTAGGKPSRFFGNWRSISAPVSFPVVDGWNMVSVPVLLYSDYLRTSVYPTSSSAFAYRGAYQVCDTLKNGEGYWVKFGTSQSVEFSGSSIRNDSFDVRPNWNMIGSISTPVAVSNINSEPGGIITSNFFDYNGAYSISDSILPGRAYWVKVNQSGKLILSDSPHASPTTRIRIVSTDELPPLPPDNSGNLPGNLPKEFALAQNYPNPFNPLTVIRYQLPVASIVKLKIFDVLGQEVMTLVDGIRVAGSETTIFDARTMASGIYFYRIDAACVADPSQSFTEVMKMILMK